MSWKGGLWVGVLMGALTSCASNHDSCVEVDRSTFDTSCSVDSDCIEIASGMLCDGNCLCPNDTINANGAARYQALAASVPRSGPICSCAGFRKPRCVQGTAGGTCTMCPPYLGAPPGAAGCPDGG